MSASVSKKSQALLGYRSQSQLRDGRLESGQEENDDTDSISYQQEFMNQNLGRDRFIRKYTYNKGGAVQFDQSNLPHMNTLRYMYIMQCILVVAMAPAGFLYLGYLQELHDNKCFFNAQLHINLKEDSKPDKNETKPDKNTTVIEKQLIAPAPDVEDKDLKNRAEKRRDELRSNIDQPNTKWGDDTYCRTTVFTHVSIWMLNVILGWMSIQVWPETMSSERGVVLASVYIVLDATSVGTCIYAVEVANNGTKNTCRKMYLEEKPNEVSCMNITSNMSFIVNPNNGVYQNKEIPGESLHHDMFVIRICLWVVTGLTINKLALAVLLMLCIWVFYYRDPKTSPFQYDSDNSSSSDTDSVLDD